MTPDSTSVLVVGGSLVGLSTALLLAWHGVPTVLVERHAGSSPHPRAIGYTTRTLEILRAVGLEDQIPQVPVEFRLRRARVESLAGRWHDESDWTPEEKAGLTTELSPCAMAAFAQDKIEPLLRERALQLGAELRLSTELLSFAQDESGVTASVRTRDGKAYDLRAAYMVAADGGRSQVREALGIGTSGRGHMQTVRSVLFRAPLDEYLAKGVLQFEIDQPDLQAFLTTYNDGRWVLMFTDDVERDEVQLRKAIIQSIGRSDLAIEIITTGRWELGAVVADRFSSGRVFLAGDAAHCFPPTRGGYGANTGIHDANNLAWKLAAVLAGMASPRLLETYDAERRPLAWLRHQQIFARPDYAHASNGVAAGEPILDDAAMELGELYRSAVILGAGDDLPRAARPERWAGQPGTRAPHVWVEHRGRRVSTLDLLLRGWVLFADDDRWADAVATARSRLKVEVQYVRLGADIRPRDEVRAVLGLGDGGASLVRPDGIVAWRARECPSETSAALNDALTAAACASS